MNILHTADWHIGQSFHQYDRTREHEAFLSWLVNTLEKEAIDVLLISGDVFDLVNPSAKSVKQFYSFLNKATRTVPHVQIIVTAGNHDSAPKLESVTPLLESTNIHIVGYVEWDQKENRHLFEKLTIPLRDKQGELEGYCLAIPYLRYDEISRPSTGRLSYQEEVANFYQKAHDYAKTLVSDREALIAMGHLHVQSAEVTSDDQSERYIMGGIEALSSESFQRYFAYVALGHIHKAQKIGNAEHIRYSGSPIPMSFSERNYKHQVIKFKLEAGQCSDITAIEVPVSVPVKSLPIKHATISEVLEAISYLEEAQGRDMELAPYLEVRVLETEPDPSRKARIMDALKTKYARLATINLKIKGTQTEEQDNDDPLTDNAFTAPQPVDLFTKAFQINYEGNMPSESLLQLFQIAEEHANSTKS